MTSSNTRPGGPAKVAAWLGLVAPLVPAGQRRRWRDEWRAELYYAHRTGRPHALRMLSALPHAIALRWQELRPDMFALDVRQAFRQILHAPGFTAIVVLTLGIGIGANALVYSILQSTVLDPLGSIDDERLVYLWRAHKTRSMRVSIQIEDLDDWRESIEGLDEVHAVTMQTRHVSGPVEPVRLQIGSAPPGFFSFLGVAPILGRTFADDEGVEGRDRVIVLGYGMWRTQFGGDPEALGESVMIDEIPHTVIGVLPRDFGLQAPHNLIRAWTPLVASTAPRGATALARLAPGSTVEQVNAELAALPVSEDGPMAEWVGIAETPQERVGQGFRTVVWSFQGAVFLVLLVAGANTANLLLARGSKRRREIAVRAALGAGRGRLVRQLLAESLLLSLGGGLLGLGIAVLGLRLVEQIRPDGVAYFETLRIDGSVFGVVAALAIGCGVLFGLLPAFQTSGDRLIGGLAEGGRGGSDGPRGSRLRGVLVVAEVALSTLLLIGAGLLVASFLRLLATDPGFDPEDVLAAQVAIPENRYQDQASRAAFWERLRRDVEVALGPRAEAVGVATGIPPRVGVTFGKPEPEGGPAAEPDAVEQLSSYASFTPEVFAALRMPFLAGGPSTEADEDVPVVINETFARRLWGETQVVGRRASEGGESWYRVVGVVPDVKAFGLANSVSNQQIFALLESDSEWYETNHLVIRARDPLSLVPTLRQVAANIDGAAVVTEAATAREMLGSSIALQRFNAQLMAGFAAVALGLALVGIYGVLSYSVAARVPELGIRMALGADARSVLSLVGRQGALLLGFGLTIGLAGATFASRLITSQLHGVEPTDPATYVATAALLLAVGLAACAVPAWRATRVDPLIALRAD